MPDDPDLYFIQVPNDDSQVYITLGDHGCLIGWRVPGEDAYEVHLALTDNVYGKAVYALRKAIKWFYEQPFATRYLRAYVPEDNYRVRYLAIVLGFTPHHYEGCEYYYKLKTSGKNMKLVPYTYERRN